MKLLLISNSGTPLYHWCKKEIADFLGERKVLFVSAANVFDPEKYYNDANKSLAEVGIKLTHLNLDKTPDKQIEETESILVGGGNTYHLLSELRKARLIGTIRRKIKNGIPYVGLSAGANIAGPNILTTNDWNVVSSKVFEALGLVPFNINPHYVGPHDKKKFSGESRDDRIKEYHEIQSDNVLGIEEKTMVFIEDIKIKVAGEGKVKLFVKNQNPKEYKNGESFRF
ncbi:MAG: dipeptidase PepE [Patescibacteria group bacterium]